MLSKVAGNVSDSSKAAGIGGGLMKGRRTLSKRKVEIGSDSRVFKGRKVNGWEQNVGGGVVEAKRGDG